MRNSVNWRSAVRKSLTMVLAVGLALGSGVASEAAKKKPKGPSLPLVRDAEIEGLLRLYSRPIFKVAGLNPNAVKVYIVRQDNINAFVAEGQRLFINTGLLTRAKTPNEVIGVIAHETGHLSGGHLARMGIELEKATVQAIIGTLLGAAAAVGGAASGNDQLGRAGGGVMMGAQTLAQRSVLAYSRDMEASADQAALKYLTATKQSARGMIEVFQTLANENIVSLSRADPYAMSHPMPLARIRALETSAKSSPFFDATDSAAITLRHRLMQAKLHGFMLSPQQVFQRYPSSDVSPPARYARAIASFRKGDTATAVELCDGLIQQIPSDPYFYELKGQALLDGGQATAALQPLVQANKLLPNNGLLQILYAQALLATGRDSDVKQAMSLLIQAKRTERDSFELYNFLAIGYGRLNDVPRAELAAAEAAMLSGDRDLARQHAEGAMEKFKRGSPEWLRANDILTFAARKK